MKKFAHVNRYLDCEPHRDDGDDPSKERHRERERGEEKEKGSMERFDEILLNSSVANICVPILFY